MMRRIGGTLFTIVLVVMAMAAVLVKSADAREVAGESIWNLFRFFTTPFILEFSLAVVGLLAVTTYNQWRRDKDGPEWVELEVPTPEPTEQEPPAH